MSEKGKGVSPIITSFWLTTGRIWHRNKEWEIGERWAKIRRGWVYGGDGFRAYMQEMLDGVMEGNHRESYSVVAVKKHDEREAQRLLSSGLVKLRMDGSDLPALKKGDVRKKVITWIIRNNTSVRNEWIVQQRHMGRASNLSRYVKEVADVTEGELWELRKMM